MLAKHLPSIRFTLVILLILLSTGCSTSSVVSKSPPSNNTYKLKTVKVSWIEKSSIPINIGIRRHKYFSDPNFSFFEKEINAKKRFAQLWNLFHRTITSQMKEQLALNGVTDGNEAFLQITPVSAEVYYGKMDGINQKFIIRASISDSISDRELWYVEVSMTEDFDETDQMMVDAYTAILMKELKSAGWLN